MLRWRAHWLQKQMTGKLMVKANQPDFEASCLDRAAALKSWRTLRNLPAQAREIILRPIRQRFSGTG
jgi:hypothetical protein